MVDQEMIEILQSFLSEARAMIDESEPRLIELQEKNAPGAGVDVETVNAVFRLFHSLKGASSSFGFMNVSTVTHSAETLLDVFRQGKAELRSEQTNILLKVIDFLRESFDSIEQYQIDEAMAASAAALKAELMAAIDALGGKAPSAGVVAPVLPPPAPDMQIEITAEMKSRFATEAQEMLETAEQILLEMEKKPGMSSEKVRDAFRSVHSFKGNCGFMGLADLERLSHKMEEVLERIKDGLLPANANTVKVLLGTLDMLRGGVEDLAKGGTGTLPDAGLMIELVGSMLGVAKPAASALAMPAAPAPQGPAKTAAPVLAQKEIRVNLDKLDVLINLVGELVIAESMVTRCPAIAQLDDERFDRAVHQLRRITADLQDVSMSVRMIPLSSTFRKMTRLVHDLSAKTGKQVKLELVGEETEVDKTVIELIGDPLVQIVRNSLDHGLELPEERRAAGKPETGTLTIEAKHESGEVWILIRDDGRGLNRDKILKKGIEQGLIQGDGPALSDEKIFSLIFEPGFSTADKVTDVSGRGVGMDVVKKNMEKMKGRIDLRSRAGQGTTVILRIPLTLAIIAGMLIRVGRSKYTIPMLTVRESFKASERQITVTPDGQEVVRVREELVPVVRLHALFKKKAALDKIEEGIIIVVEADGKPVAVFADEIIGQQETVIKGLSGYFGNVSGVSGCTILGDGEISLILDVPAVVAALLKSREAMVKNEKH